MRVGVCGCKYEVRWEGRGSGVERGGGLGFGGGMHAGCFGIFSRRGSQAWKRALTQYDQRTKVYKPFRENALDGNFSRKDAMRW